jgi:hypothetical protein
MACYAPSAQLMFLVLSFILHVTTRIFIFILQGKQKRSIFLFNNVFEMTRDFIVVVYYFLRD